MAGTRGPPFELPQHLVKRNLARFEHHQQVVKHIRRLGAQGLVALPDGGDDELHRFFAKFLGRSARPFSSNERV